MRTGPHRFRPGMHSAHRAAERFSDQVAYGLLKALAEQGLGSEDCAVVGIDDLQASTLWTPSVSSGALPCGCPAG